MLSMLVSSVVDDEFIGGVMVSVLVSSVVDREFIGPRGATCLSADCCFSEQALLKSNSACLSRTRRTTSSSHGKLTYSRHDISEQEMGWC